ncbi:MAG: protein kinase [Actinobacteria bacterium]|nr:protein kinase [Actinomycetota bacterium]
MEFTVPGYRVEKLLGAGSHAEVWSGQDDETGEPVALKRIELPGGDPDRLAELVAVARAEAALLTVLSHPNLIRLHRYVQTPTAAVLVMELAEGGSLAGLLRRRERLTPAEVAAALSPVAAALAFAHDEGVVHGDISAGNILFTSAGRAKLSDLGVARMASGARMAFGDRSADRVLGTPAYLDPVVAAGGTTSPSSDLFSLAAVALHCLTGAGPWQAAAPVDLPTLLARASTGVIDGLDDRLAGCPAPMAAVLRRALDPEPCRRGTAAEFALDLGASVPPGSVILAAGRIPPRVGRHSVDRQAPAVTDAVPLDLTQVARLQVRPEPAEPRPARRWRRDRQPNRRVALAALVTVMVLTGLLATAAVRGRSWLSRADGSLKQRAASPATAGSASRLPAGSASRLPAGSTSSPNAGSASPPAAGSASRPAAGSRSAEPATSTPAAPPESSAGQAGPTESVEAVTVLRRLADRRAAAFAANRPELLAAVYQSPVLLAEDAALLGSRVPAGCALAGVQTSYTDVTVTRSTDQRIEVRVTASQPPATLMCQGAVRGRTAPAAPARLAVTLLKVGADFRIAAQQASS